MLILEIGIVPNTLINTDIENSGAPFALRHIPRGNVPYSRL